MTESAFDVVIDFPLKLTPEQIRRIFDRFREDEPEEFQRWIEIEKDFSNLGEFPLNRTSSFFERYIKNRVNNSSHMGISSLFLRCRGIIYFEYNKS